MDTTFLNLKKKSILVVKSVIFLEDKYLLRRDSGNKVVMKGVQNLNTNVISLDENLVLENLQVQTKGRYGRVSRQLITCNLNMIKHDY